MPIDSQGQYRHNHEAAQMHSQKAGKEYKPEKQPLNEESGDAHELHPHGDGTFHTVHRGEKVDHPTLGHALIHMAKAHAEEGHTHFHAHHDGMTHHSHSVHGGGEEPESRESDDAQGAHDHLSEAMGAEEQPGQEEEQEQPEEQGAGLSGLY